MKLLLDENCENLKSYMEKKEYDITVATDVLPILDGEKSVRDSQIIEYAKKERMIIISYDKGLKEKAAKAEVPIVDPSSPGYQADLLDRELQKMSSWKPYL